MSWAPFKDSLMSDGNLKGCAILNIQNAAVWTATSDFEDGGECCVSPEQLSIIVKGYEDNTSLRERGIFIGNPPSKYIYLQSDDKQIQGKKGSGGISIAKCEQCIVIGTYGEGQQHGKARAMIQKMADHLTGQGY